jgi:hypothetical protein
MVVWKTLTSQPLLKLLISRCRHRRRARRSQKDSFIQNPENDPFENDLKKNGANKHQFNARMKSKPQSTIHNQLT